MREFTRLPRLAKISAIDVGARVNNSRSELCSYVFTIIKENACPLPTEAPDIKLNVNAKAKEVLQADKTKKARAVILPLLKTAELECPGASLPKPDNVVRKVNRARSIKLPKNPIEHSLGFDVDHSGIEPGFLQDDIRVSQPTKANILLLTTLSLLSLLHAAEFWGNKRDFQCRNKRV
jgi:hypothetical protein